MPYLDIASGRIFYTITSPTSPCRATLLLHHGLGSTHAYYSSITPLLTSNPHSFRCITYDTISSGLSSLSQGPQSIKTLADDAIAVLDALNIQEKVVIVGHSIGGVVATSLAATQPARFTAAIMLGPVLPSPALKAPFEDRIAKVEQDGMEVLANTVPTAATGSESTPLQHAMIRALLLSQKPEGYCSMCGVVASATAPDYAAMEMPTLLISADEDKSAPLEGCREIYRRTGGRKRMEVLEGVGHWFCVEDAGNVARLVGGFVEEVLKTF